ncbi:MAG: succinyl-CoA--3-ketoacid-CoA transferase, partial [Clostridiaceae bacterium]|nr:succinyl-CoA--3-ketoacid-CoA transferase [Clostridiaceae bacterium]
MNPRERIARRVARLFKDGDVVNLGIGMPTLVANFIPEDDHIVVQSQNGFLRVGLVAPEGYEDPDIVDAGGQPVSILTGG